MMPDRGDAHRGHDTAAQLLRDAMASVDPLAMSGMIGAPVDQLQRWAEREDSMSFPARMATVMAVIALAPMGSDLFREGARLRAQLAATLEYQSGVTGTSDNARRH